MTNFEKWKQNLKIENLIIDNGEDVDEDEFRFLGAIDCKKCPAKETCMVDYWKGCGDNFMEWAKSEARDVRILRT